MTAIAQAALRRIIEKYYKNCRFIIICNQINKLIPAIQSRCLRFRFTPLKHVQGVSRLMYICEQEKFNLPVNKENVLSTLFNVGKGDMRRILNILEATALSYNNEITEDNIYSVAGKPSLDYTKDLILRCMEDDIKAIDYLMESKVNQGFDLSDLVDQLISLLIKDFNSIELNDAISLLSSFYNVDYGNQVGSNDKLLISCLVSSIRNFYKPLN